MIQRIVLAFIALLVVSAVAPGPADASTDPKSCGSQTISTSLPLVRGKVFAASITINEDCSITVSPARQLTGAEISAVARAQVGPRRSNIRKDLPTISESSPVGVDPDYHMDSHVWDCCNIIMTQLHTDLTWTSNGSSITSWSAGGWTTNHPEGWPSCGPGWQLASSYLTQWAGGTGQSMIEVRAHGEWSYRGVFDCGGTQYYNVFDNYVYGFATGVGTCSFSYSLRKSVQGWHLQAYCNDPYMIVFDKSYPNL